LPEHDEITNVAQEDAQIDEGALKWTNLLTSNRRRRWAGHRLVWGQVRSFFKDIAGIQKMGGCGQDMLEIGERENSLITASQEERCSFWMNCSIAGGFVSKLLLLCRVIPSWCNVFLPFARHISWLERRYAATQHNFSMTMDKSCIFHVRVYNNATPTSAVEVMMLVESKGAGEG
jgi:hypothetical protein